MGGLRHFRCRPPGGRRRGFVPRAFVRPALKRVCDGKPRPVLWTRTLGYVFSPGKGWVPGAARWVSQSAFGRFARLRRKRRLRRAFLPLTVANTAPTLPPVAQSRSPPAVP